MKTLRSKLFWGLFFLFSVILLLGISSSVWVYHIGGRLLAVTQDNTRSVEYSTAMLQAINSLNALYVDHMFFGSSDSLSRSAFDIERQTLLEGFRQNFRYEASSARESGEKKQVDMLDREFGNYLKMVEEIHPAAMERPSNAYYRIQRQYEKVTAIISDIYNTNMRAMLQKNAEMERMARRSIIVFFFICGVSLIVAAWFITYFPNQVTRPFRELTEKIQAISRRNFNQEIKLASSGEFKLLAEAFNIMVRRLREYEDSSVKELLFEKRRMIAVMDNLNDAVMVLDDHKNILSLNRVAQEMIGVPAPELLGKYAPDVAANHDLVREMIRDIMPQNRKVNIPRRNPVKLIRNGKTAYYQPEKIPIHSNTDTSSDNHLIGYVLVLKNITLAEARNAEKKDFIAHVSHELKTPISSINLSLKMLEDQRVGELNVDQKELLSSIRKQNDRLLRVVNEVTEFTRRYGENAPQRLN